MRLPAVPNEEPARTSIALGYAREFQTYIRRYRARHQSRPHVTLAKICQRFRLTQAEACLCIDTEGSGLILSAFSYSPPPVAERDGSRGWGMILVHAYHPVLDEAAPLGRRLVMLLDEEDACEDPQSVS